MNNKILYWPGRDQNLDILKNFRKELQNQGFELEYIDIKYDEGTLNPSSWKQVIENEADWWIGISLGASLLYYCLKIAGNKKPERVTLINPFYSREVLSKEKNFNLEKQWNFAPIEFKEKVNKLDMVLSINDTKIPMYHGAMLLNNAICDNKKIIFVNGNHTVDNDNAQLELARALENMNSDRGDKDERNNYCNIYK